LLCLFDPPMLAPPSEEMQKGVPERILPIPVFLLAWAPLRLQYPDPSWTSRFRIPRFWIW